MREKRYSPDTLRNAIDLVRSGSLSAYKAHKIYGIPKSTLSFKIRNKHSGIYGKKLTLSSTHEKQLADWIILCASSGNPKTALEIREAASELAELEGKRFKDELATVGWLQKFLRRHPNISQRTPESLGKASSGLSIDRLRRYFDYLHNQFEEKGMLHLMDQPESWWNVDETNFQLNPVPKKVYAEKGSKVVYNVERGNPKENITCTYAVAADGNYIPPLITFKESFSNLVEAATVSGSLGANFGFNTTASGWMKGDAFFNFVTQHLHPRWNQMKINRPIVLVVDGYSGHHSLKLYRWCYENEVMLVVLYPNATHILQVLDVAVFGPLKAKYSELFQKWKYENPDKTYDEIEFVKLLKRTNDKVIKVDTIVNGWRSTGLQPFCFENLKTNRFLTVLSNPNEESSQDDANNPNLPMMDIPFDDIATTSSSGDGTYDHDNDTVTAIMEALDLQHDSSDFASTSRDGGFASSLEITETGTNTTPIIECDLRMKNTILDNSNTASVDHETIQLVSKVRHDLRGLRAHVKATDRSKLVNILIIEQQLNIIEPIVPEAVEPTVLNVRTVEDVLKTPNIKNNTKRKRKGMKISYGVMSDKQIINEMERREADELKIAEEKRADETAKAEKARILKEAKEELAKENERLKTARNRLKALQAEASTERKRVADKRKVQKQRPKQGKQLIDPESESSNPKSVKKIVI